jgi:hypothetical protein
MKKLRKKSNKKGQMAIFATILFSTFSIFFDGLKILKYSLRYCCYILSPKALTVQSMILKKY